MASKSGGAECWSILLLCVDFTRGGEAGEEGLARGSVELAGIEGVMHIGEPCGAPDAETLVRCAEAEPPAVLRVFGGSAIGTGRGRR